MEIVRYTSNGIVHLKVKDYFSDPRHIENDYDDGLYHTLPKGNVKDIYQKGHICTNWMEWAFNNSNQPTAEYDTRRDVFVPFLDGSHANATKNIGSLKTIWNDFVKAKGLLDTAPDDIDINVIESDFWDYYISGYSSKFNRSVEILRKYVKNRRSLMTKKQRGEERSRAPLFADNEIWMQGCHDFLKHLVYTTPRGYIMETILLTVLKQQLNADIEYSNSEDEGMGIDGYVILSQNRIPISLKPYTYKQKNNSPLHTPCWLIYQSPKKTGPDLIFEFKNGQELLFGE